MLSPELTTAKVQRRKLLNLVSLAFRKEDVRSDKRFPGNLLRATGKWAMFLKTPLKHGPSRKSILLSGTLYSIRHITLYVPYRLLRVDLPLLFQAQARPHYVQPPA